MSHFSEHLLQWYHLHKRDLPWRETDDPYKIWISEIMLQQTRVDTVIPYYQRFLEKFPTVFDLAEADQQEVLKAWEGLGYYSRGRNLHQAAKIVVKRFDGKLPSTYEEITSLKGIGPYTASAVLSIAFQKKYAVVDGNVIRVLSRFYGIEDDIRKSTTKKSIQNFADELIPESNPADFNQAIMELGAMVCTSNNPDCNICPVSAECVAANSAQTDVIPYKSPAKKVPHHQIGIGILIRENHEVLIALRREDAMLGGLWEFPGGKQKNGEPIEDTVRRELREELGVEVQIIEQFMRLKHAYSHFKITLHAFICQLSEGIPSPKTSQEIKWVPIDTLGEYPFPKANRDLTNKLMSKEFLQKELNL